jgi:hypothetical protein
MHLNILFKDLHRKPMLKVVTGEGIDKYLLGVDIQISFSLC